MPNPCAQRAGQDRGCESGSALGHIAQFCARVLHHGLCAKSCRGSRAIFAEFMGASFNVRLSGPVTATSVAMGIAVGCGSGEYAQARGPSMPCSTEASLTQPAGIGYQNAGNDQPYWSSYRKAARDTARPRSAAVLGVVNADTSGCVSGCAIWRNRKGPIGDPRPDVFPRPMQQVRDHGCPPIQTTACPCLKLGQRQPRVLSGNAMGRLQIGRNCRPNTSRRATVNDQLCCRRSSVSVVLVGGRRRSARRATRFWPCPDATETQSNPLLEPTEVRQTQRREPARGKVKGIPVVHVAFHHQVPRRRQAGRGSKFGVNARGAEVLVKMEAEDAPTTPQRQRVGASSPF